MKSKIQKQEEAVIRKAERPARSDADQIGRLDRKLGKGRGAVRERKAIQSRLDATA
jgi:hypothetical protein